MERYAKLYQGPAFGPTRWTVMFVAQAGTVYGLAYQGCGDRYPETIPFALTNVGIADVRKRPGADGAAALLPTLKPADGSRYPHVRTDTSLVRASRRHIGVIEWMTRACSPTSWKRLAIGHYGAPFPAVPVFHGHAAVSTTEVPG